MAVSDKIISFWKQVKLKSSGMFTLFKVGIGLKFPTHKLHIKDSTDPLKIEGLQNDTTDPDKFLTIDSSNIVKYRTGAQLASDIEVSIDDLHGAGVDGAANQLLTDDGDGTVTSESTLTYTDSTLTLNSAVSGDPNLMLTSSADDGIGASLTFTKARTGADDQALGYIWFIGQDASDNSQTYAIIKTDIQEADHGSEGGEFQVTVATHDGGLSNGLRIVDGDADAELDVTIAAGAASVTTIAGTLTMGSTATINNSGVIQVATQGTIDHDSLANFVAAEHYRWDTDISATATINAANIPTLNQDTTGNATTATNLTTGDKTLAGIITTKGHIIDGDRNGGGDGNGVAIHVDSMDITDNTTSASGTVLMYNHISIENPRILATNSSVTTTNASTVYIKGAPAASTNQTITNSYALHVATGDAYFGANIIAGNNRIKDDDGVSCIIFDSSGNTTIANTLNATLTGNVTGNASGSSGSCTGNAATATALATARAINGVDFDGTAAITIPTSPGWLGSSTRIKILPSDFIADDGGRPVMIDDTGSDRWLESHSTLKMYASIAIPTGYTATECAIYGSATSAITVYEADIDSKTVTSKGTGNIGTAIDGSDFTNVASDTTNYLLIELAQASGEEVYGGYITIAAT